VRLHDVARSFVVARFGDRERERFQRALAARLGDDPASRAEALRLHIEEGDVRSAAALVERDGEKLLAAGLAPRLQRWLVGDVVRRAPELASFRLRIAVASGDDDALAAIELPERPTDRDRLLFAEVLLARGAFSEAADVARPALDGELRFEAGRLVARALVNSGAAAEAITLLEELDADAPRMVLRDADLAVALLLAGAREDARALAVDIASRLGPLSGEARQEVAHAVAFVRFSLGDLRGADASLSLVAGDAGFVLASARRIFLRAAIAHARGDIETAERLAERLSRSSSLFARVVCEQLRFLFGASDVATVERIIEDARASDRHDILASALTLRAKHAIARAEREVAVLERPRPTLPLPWAHELALHEALLAVHRGEKATVPAVDDTHVELRVVANHVRASSLLARGSARAARDAAIETFELARNEGYRMLARDAAIRACDAALLAGEPLPQDSLREVAVAGDEALAFFAAVAELDVRALAELVSRTSFVGRRAAAILGDPCVLDAIDERVVRAIAKRLSVVRVGEGDELGLLLDDRDRTARVDGRVVDLASRPLFWRILRVLVEAGGRASKERLAREAWEEPAYHPLRHDGRIWVAVRKLRARIEADPTTPRWLVTTDDGYAFAGVVRFVSVT
jgi:hypothetical protein